MRYVTLIIGALAVIVALWIMIGEQMSGASANAVVNAPVVTVRAPVAGNLRMPQRQLGARVSHGVVIASLEDRLVDRVRLDDLLMEQRLETAAVARISEQLDAGRSVRERLVARADVFRAHRLQELRTRLTHAEARLAILQSDEPLTAEEAALLDTVEEGSEAIPGEPRRQSLVLEHARERVEVLRIALDAAEQGVFLGDGYNDAPNAEQRAVELESEIADLTAQQAEAAARLAAVEERIGRERLRVNSLTGGEITSPVDGIFWEVLQADGVTVQRGDPLVRLVDCGSTVVTLSVTERVYNRLDIGQAAKFRLAGTATVYDATISRMAGSGAETIYGNLAVAPSQRHLERFDVTLIVPELQQAEGAGCLIGRTGRAFFDNRPLDWLRGLFG